VVLLRAAWVAILASSLVLQITSSVALSLKLRANFDGLIDGEPYLLARVDHQLASAAAAHSGLATASFLVVELAMLLAALPSQRSRPMTVPLLLLVLGTFWIFGENFAGLFTGSANDVGTAPLLAVIVLATFPRLRSRAPAAVATPQIDGPNAVLRRHRAFT
jgi:hypothetical protein